MEFGEWLRTQLRQRGETMTDFANLVGVSDATVSRWISGQRRPDVASTQRISRVLQLPTELVMELAGHEIAGAAEHEALERELARLTAEQTALEHQSRHAQERLAEVRNRVALLRAHDDGFRLYQMVRQGGTLRMGIQSSISTEQEFSSANNVSGPLEEMDESPASLPGRSLRWENLRMLYGLLPEPEHLGSRFLEEFRIDWSEREQDAFALGLQLGLRAAESLSSQPRPNQADDSEGGESSKTSRDQAGQDSSS